MHAAIIFAPLVVITIASPQDAHAQAPPEFTHSDQITRENLSVLPTRPRQYGRPAQMDGHSR